MRWTAGRRGVVLPVALLGALLVSAGASLPVDSCPRHLDCTLQRRQSCKPGSTQCGPCIEPLIENEYGNCVQKQQQHTTGGNLANVDEEIDYLASVVTKQGLQKQHLSQEALLPPLTEDKPKALDSNEVQNRLAAQIQLEQSNASLTTVAGTTVKKVTEKSGPVASHYPATDAIIFAMIIVCTVVGSTALIVAAVCWLRLQKEVRLAQKVDYPAFGVMGPGPLDSTSPGDKKLAQSAQMYHYQHQKQQMLSMEKHKDDSKVPESGTTSDEENEDGDFTVYECPGLAPTGEMEVKNPLFDDSSLHPQKNHK